MSTKPRKPLPKLPPLKIICASASSIVRKVSFEHVQNEAKRSPHNTPPITVKLPFKPSHRRIHSSCFKNDTVDQVNPVLPPLATVGSVSRTLSNFDGSTESHLDNGLDLFMKVIKLSIEQSGVCPKIIVMDFDKTITLHHTRGYQQLPTNNVERMNYCLNNIRNPSVLKSFFDYLRRNDIEVWIASFASTKEHAKLPYYSGQKLIEEYLKALYQHSPQECPVTSSRILAFQTGEINIDYFNACKELGEDISALSPTRKNVHLKLIAQRSHINPADFRKICLIDDDQHNIVLARELFTAINVYDII